MHFIFPLQINDNGVWVCLNKVPVALSHLVHGCGPWQWSTWPCWIGQFLVSFSIHINVPRTFYRGNLNDGADHVDEVKMCIALLHLPVSRVLQKD